MIFAICLLLWLNGVDGFSEIPWWLWILAVMDVFSETGKTVVKKYYLDKRTARGE